MKFHYTFFGLLFLLLSCSGKSDKDLFDEARTAEQQKNYPLAVQNYELIVRDFEKSAYAESSHFRLATILWNQEGKKELAAKEFRIFSEKYPSSSSAPTALFLAGYILNNDLHQVNDAREVYQLFLAKYPDHELADDARFEMANLGKDPNEFLPPGVSSSSNAGKSAQQ